MTITARDNPKLKLVRRLHGRRGRQSTKLFLAEGEDLLQAAQIAGWSPKHTLVSAQSSQPGTVVDADLLNEVSTLGSGCRAMAIYDQRYHESAGPLCLALWGVSDPGNVGTAIRSAAAFSAKVALGPECADPYSPKAVRASMGAIFSVSVSKYQDLSELPGQKVALVAHGAKRIVDADVGASNLTFVVGAERNGLPTQIIDRCDQAVRIPVETESLNAAMAATIALYEVAVRRSLPAKKY